MKKIHKIKYLIALLIICSCTPKNLEIDSASIGSNLDSDGEISDSSLIYKFKKDNKGPKTRDLFNYIYFEGDTLCFSFKLNKQVNYNSIKVWYQNPETGKSFPAERIDLHYKTISGFSLVGSIMEKFYEKKLGNNLKEDEYFNKNIDFIIKISLVYNDKTIEKSKPGFFRLEYK